MSKASQTAQTLSAERFAFEAFEQMEGLLALADRLGRLPLSADAQTYLSGIVETAHSVRGLMADGLDLKAASEGDLKLNLAPKRLQDLMDEVQSRWEAKAKRDGMTLLVAYEGDPDTAALVDAPRLSRIFDSFIRYGLASTRKGAVEATLRARASDDGGLRLEGRVRAGGAVERSNAEDPFDPDAIEARLGLDVAVGMMLGRQLIVALKGESRVERNAGAGETVVFAFSAAEAPAEAEAPPEIGAARAAHVLVVDDNATNRMVAETLCEMFDCTSESAVDGVEAVEAARTGRFDLILMDIKMPRLDGIGATREIRGFPGQPGRVPIIALTANADPQDAADYLSAGMNGVVEKPMKPETLLQALQEALGEGKQAA